MWRSLRTSSSCGCLLVTRPLVCGSSARSVAAPVVRFHRSCRPPLLSPPSSAARPPAAASSSPPLSPVSGVSVSVSGGGSYKVFNVALDARKPLVLALRGVYGIGAHRARVVCGQLGLNPHTPLRTLQQPAFQRLKQHVEAAFQPRHIEERAVAAAILHKVRIGCYAGIRHTQCLPVRGQRTQTNARTQRKLGRQRMIAYNLPAFNKKKPGSAGSKPQLATLAQQHAQQTQQTAQSKQAQKKAG